MNEKKKHRWVGTLALLGAFGLASPAMAAFGDPLSSGLTIVATPFTYPVVPETLIASQSISINGNPNITGTLLVDVYRETGTGTLDFFYQLTNTSPAAGGSNAFFSSLNVSNFGTAIPFQTSVGYFTNTTDNFITGSFHPQQISRTIDGGTVSFIFDPSGNPSSGLPSGPPGGSANTTLVMFISTNALAFDALGTATAVSEAGGTINLGSDAANGVFEPTVGNSVPEPSSIVLCCMAGVIGLGVHRFRRAR